MTLSSLIVQSRRHYRRFYRLVAGAVILMMAVLMGSLLLGDSVRGTLVQRVGERLGKTETILTSGTAFMSDSLMQQPLLKDAQGYLLMDGFVSVGEKLLPVYVWGTDADSLSMGEVIINEPLRAKLGDQEDFVLHLPSHNLVPSGSLFVTKSYATQMRVHVAGVKSVDEGGNLLLKNEQALPLNVFIGRQHLAEEMELEGKINLVLSQDIITEEQLADSWTPELSGIHLTDTSLTSDGIFIPQEIVNKLTINQVAVGTCFSYLANELVNNSDTLSYPFVTAVSEWQGEPLDGLDMILSDYAAERLHVSVGDSVAMSYYVAKDLKALDTAAQMFCVKRIVPLSDFMRDSLLIADFPGLSHVEKCTDWDSDLPIKMERVTKEDEDFWYAYHQTPKAILSYEAVCADWSNAFGSATALRFSARPDVSLSPRDAGMQVIHPRKQGLQSANGGVDFASLFLSLGFFIILSAILLMKNPLVEMFSQRQKEIQLYRQLGFRDKDIRKGLFREAFSVVLFASPWGVLAGLLYSALTLWLLGNVWSGATHTEGFALHIQPLSLIIGWPVGLLICAIVLWRAVKTIDNSQLKIDNYSRPKWGWGCFFLILTIVLIAVNFIYLHSMMLFIVCGLSWIFAWGLFLRAYVNHRTTISGSSEMSRSRLIWQSVRASMKQHLLAYWALSLGVFTVFAVGLNRPDFSNAVETAGGYQFYVDSRVPIQYDLNNPAVRQKLSLDGLPDSTQFLGFLRHTQDDASCLNLNQVTTPTVLGVEPPPNLPQNGGDLIPWGELRKGLLIDQEALQWSMKKSVGDTLYYQNDRGESVPLVIAGTYPTGIFHGNAIMSAEAFRRLWAKESGVEVLLMKSSRPEEAAEILATAMSEYGLDVQTVEERIKMFFEVTETYLVIFLTLGGLGLLLGIFSLMIIVRKNLTAHAATIRQYRAMGFSKPLTGLLLLRENLLVPLYATGVGATGSVISISGGVGGAGLATFLLALALLAAIYLILYWGIKYMIYQSVNNQQI